MELIENLFVAGNVTSPEAVVSRLRRDIPVDRLYCIVFFADKKRLEILSSRELFSGRYEGRPAKAAGIAMGRAEAVRLLAFMAEEALKDGRNAGDPEELIR